MAPQRKRAAQAVITDRAIKPLLNTIEAAPFAGVEPHTLEKWRGHNNLGPKHLKIGRRVYYDPDDILAWRESCRISSTSENYKLVERLADRVAA